MIKCATCKQWKDTSQYWVKRTKTTTGYQSNCKPCSVQRNREDYELRKRVPRLGVATMTPQEFWGTVDQTTRARRSAQR